MGKPCPTEFRDDVVRVARGRDPGVTAPKRMPASRTPYGHSPAFTDLDEVVELEITVRPARKRFALRYL